MTPFSCAFAPASMFFVNESVTSPTRTSISHQNLPPRSHAEYDDGLQRLSGQRLKGPIAHQSLPRPGD